MSLELIKQRVSLYLYNMRLLESQKHEIMADFSQLNIQQAILPADDKKQPLKENSSINWGREELMAYFDKRKKMMKEKEWMESTILPSSPETFKPF